MANGQGRALTRRATLAAVAAGFGAAAFGSSAKAQAAPRTFVLVHGSWHGGWCWRRVSDRLEKLGHGVRADIDRTRRALAPARREGQPNDPHHRRHRAAILAWYSGPRPDANIGPFVANTANESILLLEGSAARRSSGLLRAWRS